MTQATRQLVAELACSELAAREFIKHGLVIVQCFRKLRKHYDIDLVIDIKRRLLRDSIALNTFPRKIARAIMSVLPSPDNRLCAAYRKADQADQQFYMVFSTFGYPAPYGKETLKETLTVVLEALHNCRMMEDPETVAEGKLIYEALDRDRTLRRDLGL